MRLVERVPIGDIPETLRAQLDDYSFYSSPGFAALWESMGGTGVCWILMDGDKILASMPGVEFRVKPFVRFQAMTDGCYARCCCVGDTAERKDACEMLMNSIARAGYAKVIVSDYYRELTPVKAYHAAECETPVVDISEPGWQPPDGTLRSEIRKAEREGVVVGEFYAAMHLDKCMDLMSRTESRHGRRPKYSREFFTHLAQLAARDRRVRWRYVEHEGEPVTSHIFFIDGAMALNWQVYFDKRFSFLKANQLVLFATARELAAMGVTSLNLGASPPEAESLRSYKEKWGGVERTYPIYTYCSWIGRMV